MSEKIQVRRGTNAERLTVTLDQGEPAWTTDTKRIYFGDGVTVGGILANPISGNLLINSSDIITGNENRFAHVTGNENVSGVKNFHNTLQIGAIASTGTFGQDTRVDVYRYQLFDANPFASLDWNLYQLLAEGSIALDWTAKILSGNWRVATADPPSTATSVGKKGTLSVSGNMLCICTGTNQWGKITINPF